MSADRVGVLRLFVIALLFSGPAAADRAAPLKKADSWAYQLQKVDLEALKATDYDVFVIDYAGEDGTPWTAEEIEALKHAGGRRRVVLAYLSVGEAESYRPYWRDEWRTERPAWLGPENPRWPENFPVRYWDPGWQVLFLGPGAYLDHLLEQGFDGVYLDRLDVYSRWGPTGEGEEHEERSARAMVEWVRALAGHLREVRGREDMLVVAQNAPFLAQQPGFVELIDAFALEDLFYTENRRQPKRYTREILGGIEPARERGLPVFTVDYLRRERDRRAYDALARRHGVIPLASPSVELDRLP